MGQIDITENAAKGDLSRLTGGERTDAFLERILATLERIEKSGKIPSLANAMSDSGDGPFSEYYRQLTGRGSNNTSSSDKPDRSSLRSSSKGFTDSLEEALIEGFLGSNFKDDVAKIFQGFADQLGTSIKDIPSKLGQMLGKQLMDRFKSTPRGQSLSQYGEYFRNRALNSLQTRGQSIIDRASGSAASSGSISNTVSAQTQSAAHAATEGLESVAESASEFVPSISGFVSAIGPAAAGLVALEIGSDAAGEALSGVKDLFGALSKAANRDQIARQKNQEAAQKRLQADVELMVRKPFQILQKAAEEWYDAWDNNLRTISATQGYTKADVQDLMSSFAQRLQQEGLTSYVSSADISNNLEKVLKSGLSGKLAEEFAYQATVLNAAVPTQDFFDYASAYASVAANAVKAGKSQEQAITEANKTLSDFTSGLLYASRELSGGFTTGLQDASSIYEQAVKIAQASKTGNVSDIAGVLLAVRGEVGAVAPDLASSITDTIYKMLTGGNASDIVALRSLAGVNASNTEFLRAVADNPKQIFSTLFENLAAMYGQSSDAYMEKAEGYAELFGLSSEAFQRVDFTGLASAISRMNVDNAALNENMELLLEGQTTTNADQLRMQKINQYMIDEGLSLVLDNEAARMVQEHMWEEQIARQITEATFAVDLQGEALQALTKIVNAVSRVVNLLNPFSWFKKAANIINTSSEGSAQQADIQQLLALGQVGNRDATRQALALVTRNQDLNVVEDLITMMGGTSLYKYAHGVTMSSIRRATPLMSAFDSNAAGEVLSKLNMIASARDYQASLQGISSPTSSYSWGSVSKSMAQLSNNLLSLNRKTEPLESVLTPSGTSATSSSASAAKSAVEAMMKEEYIVNKFVKAGKSYSDWKASASSFGISDIAKAIADAGYNESDIEKYFEDKETEEGTKEKQKVAEEEKFFRDTGVAFWMDKFWTEYQTPMFDKLDLTNAYLDSIGEELIHFRKEYKEWAEDGWSKFFDPASGDVSFNKFYSEFMKYFIEHEYYSTTKGYKYSDVEAIQEAKDAQDRGDTVYALAEMLTKNMVDLKDPTMQTNVLLSQILLVINAIQQNQNSTAGSTLQSTLLDSLSAMSLGLSGYTNLQ